MDNVIKVNDVVTMLQCKHISGLRHRKNHNGVVTYIDGSYILVRPMWLKREIEFYPNELKKLGRIHKWNIQK